MGNLHKVIRPLNIKLVDPVDYRANQSRKRVCCCEGTIRRVMRRYGEGHLSLTLKLIVESEGNDTELYADTITAVSELLHTFPELEHLQNLMEWFDDLDLDQMRWRAKDSRVKPVYKAMQTLLVLYFHEPLFGDFEPATGKSTEYGGWCG